MDEVVQTADVIANTFPHPVLTRVTGPPSRVDIDENQEKQTENAASRPSTRGGGQHGNAAMVVPPARYAAEYSLVPFVWEPNPGEGAVFPPNVQIGNARTLENNFRTSSRVFREQMGIHIALKNQLYRCYSAEYWTGLIQPGTGVATVTLQQMYGHLYQNFGQITEADLEESRQGVTTQFDFANQTVPAYLHLIRRCQQLHGNALPPRPITDNEAMGIAYLNLQRSGTYPLDCREWEMIDPNLRNFAQLQTRFILAERRLRASRSNGLPAGLVNNLHDLQRAMEGLTAATAQERTDAAQARLDAETLQGAVNNLQTQMAGILLPGQAAINAVGYQPPPQVRQQQQPPRQSGAVNHQGEPVWHWDENGAIQPWTPPSPQQLQQMQQQQQYFRPAGGRGQRNGGRGNAGRGSFRRGNGRHYQNPPRVQQYPQGFAWQGGQQAGYQPQQQQNQGFGYGNINNHGGRGQGQQQFGGRGPRSMRPLPTDFSYCWSHGYAVSAQHNSAMCEDQAPGHQTQATRQNTMGGNPKGVERLG